MSLSIDTDGTISICQGDTGTINVNGLETDKNYYVYFEIRDKKRNSVGEQLIQTSNNQEFVSFFLPKNLTDLLTVSPNSQYETYYYGLKIREIGSDSEDTLFVADKGYGEPNLLIVYPKQVEGEE